MSFMRDLSHALRVLRQRAGFSVVAVTTLGLAIGATAAIFALVNAVVLRPLPYRDADRLVALAHTAPGADIQEAGQSDGTFLHYQQHNHVFEDMAVYNENVVNVSGDAGPERVPVAMVSPSFFATLGARPAFGRLFSPQDAGEHKYPLVVLSNGLWRRQFGSDRGIIGRTVRLNAVPREVVGVLEPGFDFPHRQTQVWYLSTPNPAGAGVSLLAYSSIARLKPGVSADDAERELNRLIPSLAEAYPAASRFVQGSGLKAVVRPLKQEITGNVGTALWVLFGAVGCVLMIACANVANLFLVRAEHRRKELAVRAALGATRRDLARYFLAESTLLGALGGALGIGIADAAVRALVALGPANMPRLSDVRLDGWVLAFTGVLAVVTAVVLAAIPMLRYAPQDVLPNLKETLRGAFTGPARQRARRALVVAQVALALTLLTGAALMVESIWRLKHVDPGFEASGVLTVEIALPAQPYPTYAASAALWQGLLERIRALPGVVAAGAVSDLPLRGDAMKRYYETAVTIEGRQPATGEPSPTVGVRLYLPGYFEAMRIPIVQGQHPERASAPTASVVVSASLARRFFPPESAVGGRLRVERLSTPQPWKTVLAVAGDVRDVAIQDEAPALVYVPILARQRDDNLNPTHMSLAIRTTVPPLSIVDRIRNVVREIDPDLPVANVLTMDRIVADGMARTSFTTLLLLVAAGVALALATVGIYGVIAYTVSQRTREIGVRLALGASPREVAGLVLRQGTAAVALGLLMGAGVALVLTRFLSGSVYDVKPANPLTLGASALLLLAVSLSATYLPARRAGRVDPLEALRYE